MGVVRKVTTIPATINKFNSSSITNVKKRRVAAYARVSTDNEEQLTSYEAQVDYYTSYIKNRDDWEFVDVYTDEGISGTNTKHREGFKRMVEDALLGKIDLIITKSVSRFARNTVDSLSTIRKLKENNVECYFEKENIWTFDGKGELLLTIMSSLAQEESRSISENVKWGHRKRFADGKVSMPYKHFLGYEKGEDGNIVINEKEAVTVRKIYRLFLNGLTPHSIAKELTMEGIKTPASKDKWSARTVRSILTNEKYKGDALLQKNYTIDFLTKKQKVNEGEVPQYYVENNHEGIVTNEIFEMVQQEMKRRLEGKGRYSGVDIFASKIRCGECGYLYGAKVWHSNSKYKRVIYQCNHKFKNESKCSTPHFYEDEIKELFIFAVNRLIGNKEEIICNLEIIKNSICDNSTFEDDKEKLHREMIILVEKIENCVNENARVAQSQDKYQQRYNNLVDEYEKVKDRYEELENKISNNIARNKTLEHFIKCLKNQDGVVDEFDDGLWGGLLEGITVSKGYVIVSFKDGTDVRIENK
jgi:DNA invertase Pin-like site-specific DNA recombinase